MKNILSKTIALCLFVCGISLFVLHQSGYFSGNSYGAYQGSHNGGALTISDSVYKHKRDSVRRRIQSSSKSIIPSARLEEMIDLVVGKQQPKPDTLKPRVLPSSKVYIPSKITIKNPEKIEADTIKPFTNRTKATKTKQ